MGMAVWWPSAVVSRSLTVAFLLALLDILSDDTYEVRGHEHCPEQKDIDEEASKRNLQ